MIEQTRGSYVFIDGPEGAGKTTQKDLYVEALLSRGISAEELIEPGTTPIGKLLRKIILDPDIDKSVETELDLFTAARRENVNQTTRPGVEEGKHFVSDRGWYASVAYQGFGGGLDPELIIERNREAMAEFFVPDASLILDVPVEITRERLRSRGTSADWFEYKGPEYFHKVRKGFLWLAGEFDIPVVDGTQSVEAVQQEVFSILSRAIQERAA